MVSMVVKLRKAHQISTSANISMSMLCLDIGASNSLMRKTNGHGGEQKHVEVTLCGTTATRVVIFIVVFIKILKLCRITLKYN